MAEATAYAVRVEFRIESPNLTVVAGFRKDDTLAVYFDQDPMYQFNPDGRIRRALVDGILYRAHDGTLSKLKRRRTEDQTLLERSDLSSAQLASFLNDMDQRIQSVVAAIDQRTASVTRSMPADAGRQTLTTVADRLRLSLLSTVRVAADINVAR